MTQGRAFDRLLAFSDAVVAIALTLLVLPLVDLPHAVTENANIGRVLADASNELIAFGVSFLVIWRLWASHHRIFGHCHAIDRPTAVVNFIWLATIVVLPFPTALLSTPVSERGAVPLYVAVLLVSTVTLQVMTWRTRHRPGMVDPGDSDSRDWLAGRTDWATPASMVLALILSLVFLTIGPWVMFLLFLPLVLAGLRSRLRGHRRVR